MEVAPGAKRGLLVVDDDEDILRLVSVAMKARGFEVSTAITLADGLALLEHTTFDVVLTDKNLKGATGLELIDAVAVRAPTTAVVLMTAYPEGALGRLPTIDGYVGKPFRSLDLVARALQDAIDRRERARQRQKLLDQLGEVKSALTKPAPPTKPDV
ncbi:MAG: response regulator [Myxococcaceae bacterium]|nr:response regulator [Myxococcaceae bacterium]MCA3014215.1 response regulator [Myxococcaceae bacterium]